MGRELGSTESRLSELVVVGTGDPRDWLDVDWVGNEKKVMRD